MKTKAAFFFGLILGLLSGPFIYSQYFAKYFDTITSYGMSGYPSPDGNSHLYIHAFSDSTSDYRDYELKLLSSTYDYKVNIYPDRSKNFPKKLKITNEWAKDSSSVHVVLDGISIILKPDSSHTAQN